MSNRASNALYSQADKLYKLVWRASSRAQASAITGAGTYYFPASGALGLIAGVAGAAPAPFYLKGSDWAVSGLTAYLRVVAGCLVTDTAPANTMVVGLYPVSAWAGGTTVTTATVGTVIVGSTVTFATPAANSMPAPTVTADFAFPSDGWYIVGAAIDGAAAGNSNPMLSARLEVRNA